MNGEKRMLVAIDDSDASMRAVRYVANVIGGQHGFHLHLFHVLHPLSPELLEFIGSEKIEEEEQMEATLRDAQTQWITKEKKAEQSVFKKAKVILREAGVPGRAVKTGYCTSTNRQEVAADILEAARAERCSTIVVGRESFSGLKRFLRRHVGDELIRKGQGFTIWVVE